MKIVVLPRSPNPYQRLLYEEFKRAGHSVRYAGRRTRSHTVNLLLLPLELILCRAAGWRILHIHWVYEFAPTGADRFPVLRRVGQAWFSLVLAVSRLIGLRVIWTAHNVLPHGRVFHDEVAARRRLARASEVVLVHAPAALEGLERIGVRPRRSALVRLGPMAPHVDAATLRPPGAPGGPLNLLFFGHVLEHKGVEDLLEAIALVPPAVPARLMVAGHCPDVSLRDRLSALGARCGGRVSLRLEHIPEREVTAVLAEADLVVLPFRSITTSSSVLLAMGHGRGVVLPDVPAFDDLPRDAAVLYDGSVKALREVIIDAAGWSPERLQSLGTAASAYVGTLSWAATAAQTLAAMGADAG
ncbi:MAG: glycosyltransferase [Solirubrobacterales bacterium]|nr:glycosyltransferase [Solirubrobacterales bacterium]